MKKLSLIAVIVSAVFVAGYLVFIFSRGHISQQEFMPFEAGFGIWSLLFSILVNLHFFKNNRTVKQR